MMKLTLILLALVALSNSASATRLRRKNRLLKKDKDKEGGDDGDDASEQFTGLINERHSCVTDFETQKARMPNPEVTEYGNDGSLECYADPVNGCNGGCCRTSMVYFICDSDGMTLPSLPCICNANTAEPATNPPRPVVEPPVPADGGFLMPGNTTMAPVMNATMAPVVNATMVARSADLFD